MPTAKKNFLKSFWPDVNTEEGMKNAVAAGYWSCYIVAGVTAAFIPFGVVNPWSWVDVVIMAGAGLCIQFYKSRTAAVIAFALFAAGKILMASEGRMGTNFALIIILAFGLLSGIRGTFAYHGKR